MNPDPLLIQAIVAERRREAAHARGSRVAWANCGAGRWRRLGRRAGFVWIADSAGGGDV